ncbi:MAG: ribosome maturation factor RimM [bacterium]
MRRRCAPYEYMRHGPDDVMREAVELIAIGRVVRPHGIDGTLKVVPVTDFPQHFECIEEVFLVKDRTARTTVRGARFHQGHVLLKVDLCRSRTDAEAWIGAEVAISERDLWPLEEGAYYHFQIEGLEVFTDEGKLLGRVSGIIKTGSNDVYVVREGARECLIPAIQEVIRSIDLKKGRIIVHLLEGLVD